MRRALPIVALVALVAVVAIVVIGLSQAGGDDGGGNPKPDAFDLRAAEQCLAEAPGPLAALYGRANELLPGGRSAFREQLRELRGHPVVINKWASWCGPCRHEFPFFQDVAASKGKAVAFVGVDGKDGSAPARDFLEEFPLPYPSYEDPDEEIARDIGAPANYPITVFLDEQGKQAFIRQGGYASRAQLEQDIERYLGA